MSAITADAIRDAILAERPGEVIVCHQTGGGTATIYVGEFDGTGYARVAIGPGRYNWQNEWLSEFWLEEDSLAVGPDDDGTVVPAYPTTLEGVVEAVMAVPLREGLER